MPIAFFLMKKKCRGAYVEILQLLKRKYKELFGDELVIRRVSSDAERAFILAVEDVFPETQVTLCSVHILRCILKDLKNKVSHAWYKNATLVHAWRVISGALFLNLADEEIFKEIDTFLKVKVPEGLSPDLEPKFDLFLEYLFNTYFSPTATFNFGFFQYYTNMVDFDDFSTTTNPIESINSQLKRACTRGHISFIRANGDSTPNFTQNQKIWFISSILKIIISQCTILDIL